MPNSGSTLWKLCEVFLKLDNGKDLLKIGAKSFFKAGGKYIPKDINSE